MNPGSFLRRTAAATLGVLALFLLVGAAKAAPPESMLAFDPTVGPATEPLTTATVTAPPPTIDDARELQADGNWDEAAHAWHAIVQADDENGVAWFNLGYCLHAGGHLDDAIEVHKKAATFDEFHGIALYNLGCAYALTNRPDEAFEALAASDAAGFRVKDSIEDDSDLDSLRSDPRYMALLHGSADAAGDEGDARGGGGGSDIHQFIAGIRQFIEQQLPQIEQQVAMLAQRAMEHVHQILDQVERELANDPRFGAMAEQFGQWLGGGPRGHDEEQHMPGMERRDEPRTIDLPDDDASSHATDDLESVLAKGQQLQGEGKWNEAAAVYEAATRLDPEAPAAWFGRAYCLHMGGRYEEAIKAHRKAAKFEPIRGISLYNLACAYSLTGKLDDAMMALREARRVGFDLAEPIGNDRDLDNLRDDARFQKLLSELGVDY